MVVKRILIWILAFILTIIFAYYQRVTGPTYPVKDSFLLSGKKIEIVYLRSHNTGSNAKIEFYLPDTNITGKIYFREYLSGKPYQAVALVRNGDSLVASLPSLPPAGKYQYYIELYDSNGKAVYTRKKEPVVIRFKGDVPASILIPHILFMFLAIFFGVATGLLALFDDLSFRKIQWWTLVLLLIGGFIFGPIVQKHAFGQYWTGIPYGWDLTDNKTLIMLIAWIIAIWGNRHETRRWWTVIAAVVQIIVYLIPHSLFGSTLNPETGQVTQGIILSLLSLFS